MLAEAESTVVAERLAEALGMDPNRVVTIEQATAALHRASFYEFFLHFWKFISSEIFKDNWHIEFLCDELQKVGERVIRREPKEYDLIINVPPGSSKSSLASVLFPAWLWARDPSLQFICGSYGDDLAKDLANKFRRAIVNETYRGLFPNVQLQSSGVEVIRTMQGGWRKATSAGTAIQGWHGHLQLIDDPLNTKQAVSEAELKRANDWLTQLLPGRVTDAAMTPMILIMQRLSQADCTATLLEKMVGEGTPVRHICIPAELDDGSNVFPRSLRSKYVDGLFDVGRFPQAVLDQKKIDLGDYAYAGQFQQRPSPRGGGIFKVDMLGEPATPPPLVHFVRLVRSWDKSASTTDKSPYTAGVLFGVDRVGTYWILDCIRGRWDVGERENVIKRTAARDGRNVTVVIEMEPGSGGKESALATVRNLRGFRIHVDRVTGKKEERAVPLASQVNVGHVKIAKGNWNGVLLDEMRLFPYSRYKDQCDAASQALNHLAGRRTRGAIMAR